MPTTTEMRRGALRLRPRSTPNTLQLDRLPNNRGNNHKKLRQTISRPSKDAYNSALFIVGLGSPSLHPRCSAPQTYPTQQFNLTLCLHNSTGRLLHQPTLEAALYSGDNLQLHQRAHDRQTTPTLATHFNPPAPIRSTKTKTPTPRSRHSCTHCNISYQGHSDLNSDPHSQPHILHPKNLSTQNPTQLTTSASEPPSNRNTKRPT